MQRLELATRQQYLDLQHVDDWRALDARYTRLERFWAQLPGGDALMVDPTAVRTRIAQLLAAKARGRDLLSAFRDRLAQAQQTVATLRARVRHYDALEREFFFDEALAAVADAATWPPALMARRTALLQRLAQDDDSIVAELARLDAQLERAVLHRLPLEPLLNSDLVHARLLQLQEALAREAAPEAMLDLKLRMQALQQYLSELGQQ